MLTLIRCPLNPSVTAVALRRSRSFCQKYRWQVTPKHAYTLDPTKSEWVDSAALQHNLSKNSRPQSSRLAEPLWTDPGVKCGIGVRELISTLKKKVQPGIECANRRLVSEEKSTTTPVPDCLNSIIVQTSW